MFPGLTAAPSAKVGRSLRYSMSQVSCRRIQAIPFFAACGLRLEACDVFTLFSALSTMLYNLSATFNTFCAMLKTFSDFRFTIHDLRFLRCLCSQRFPPSCALLHALCPMLYAVHVLVQVPGTLSLYMSVNRQCFLSHTLQEIFPMVRKMIFLPASSFFPAILISFLSKSSLMARVESTPLTLSISFFVTGCL